MSQHHRYLAGIIFILLLGTGFSIHAWAIYDSIVEVGKELNEIAAVAEVVGELADEVGGDNAELSQQLSSVERESASLERGLNEIDYMGGEADSVLRGPNLASGRLSSNIRRLSDYTRKVKSLVTKFTLLGEKGATVVNGVETNISLNEIQKNQQTLSAQQERLAILAKQEMLEKKREERKWRQFALEQRRLRENFLRGHHVGN